MGQQVELIQEQVKGLADNINAKDEKVTDCVVKALDVKTQEEKEEELEIKKRAQNVIVHGVPGSGADSSDQREDDDLGIISAMMHELDKDDVKVTKIIRLGKPPPQRVTEESEPSPRPIKLVLESEEQKINVLKKAKNLRLAKEGGWKKVFIHQDLTSKQRQLRKALVQEMNRRKANGEMDVAIFNGKIVKKPNAR